MAWWGGGEATGIYYADKKQSDYPSRAYKSLFGMLMAQVSFMCYCAGSEVLRFEWPDLGQPDTRHYSITVGYLLRSASLEL